MSHYNIHLIFDVGANTGQFAIQMRELGFAGRIVSFEPLSSAYKELSRRASQNPLWDAVNIALGDYDGEAEINISKNSQSSSILNMLPAHFQNAPDSVYIGKERITVRKIDTIFHDYWRAGEHLYLKLDTQGYEEHIIDGAKESLQHVIGIQIEVSLIPLYEGEILLVDTIGLLSDRGYTLMSVEPGFGSPSTGQLLQVDCIFFRDDITATLATISPTGR